MYPFKFDKPGNNQEAIALKEDKLTTKFIAGGTNLLDLMKLNIERPQRLIDITGLDLKRIESSANKSMMIGALVRNSELAYHPSVKKDYPLLSEAILAGASAQLRNMATTGGNVLQRTRCYYFYDTAAACNKREPGSGCSAINGYNRIHAILGTSDHCIATHPSDMCVALAALDAVVHVQSATGKRKIPFADFHLLPAATPEKEHALQAGELITHIEIPALRFARHSTYLKIRDRSSYEFALVSAAVALDIREGTIKDARIALGGVGTKPWRAYEAEDLLRGKKPSPATYSAAADEALKTARTVQHNAFKPGLAKRTIISALQKTGGA